MSPTFAAEPLAHLELLVRQALRRGRLSLPALARALDPGPASPWLLEAVTEALHALPRGILLADPIELRLEGPALRDAGDAASAEGPSTHRLEVRGAGGVLEAAFQLGTLAWANRRALKRAKGRPSPRAPGALGARALRCTEAAWAEANDAAEGALDALLARPFAPKVTLHPELLDGPAEAAGRRQGQALLALMAEMGLAGRPWHLWLGPRGPTDRLSPYARDLEPGLVAWAQARATEAAASDYVPAPATREPDWPALAAALEQADVADGHWVALHEIARAFVASDPKLAAERAEAERTVGIQAARLFGMEVELVDVARLDGAQADPRVADLLRTPVGPMAPVLIRMALSPEWDDGRVVVARLARFVAALGAGGGSVTLCLPGRATGGGHAHLWPDALLDAATGHPIALDAPQGPTRAVQAAAIALDGPPSLARRLARLSPEQDAQGLPAWGTASGGHLIAGSLGTLRARGLLPAQAPIRAVVYDEARAAQGLDRAALEALAAILAPKPGPIAEGPGAQSPERKGQRGQGVAIRV